MQNMPAHARATAGVVPAAAVRPGRDDREGSRPQGCRVGLPPHRRQPRAPGYHRRGPGTALRGERRACRTGCRTAEGGLMDNKSRDIALHRYVLVREAADPSLTPAQRGELVRALAAVEHLGPDGSYVKVSRPTLDRWIRRWRAGGFDALAPKPRRSVPVIPRELLELAADLKREAPKRTAVQIAEIIKATRGSSPSARTIQRHFAMTGLNRTP